jgi:hypothetical protein
MSSAAAKRAAAGHDAMALAVIDLSDTVAVYGQASPFSSGADLILIKWQPSPRRARRALRTTVGRRFWIQDKRDHVFRKELGFAPFGRRGGGGAGRTHIVTTQAGSSLPDPNNDTNRACGLL